MMIDKALMWQIVRAADNVHGWAAEAQARAHATRAAPEGDAAQSALWQASAKALHMLHAINCHGTCLRR